MDEMNSIAPPERRDIGMRIAFAALASVYIALVIRAAWLCDDAYITFRTIDNFTHGYGLRWNVAERVQTFTHPLWLLVLLGIHTYTREIYFTSLITSIVLAGATVAVLYLGPKRRASAGACLALCAMIGSKAFIEYSTSGLENVLSHFLLLCFLALYLRRSETPRGLFWLAFVAGLICLNRLDLALLVGPALMARLLNLRSWRAAGIMAMAFAPLAAWEVLSIIYYGFPFPNTAYAKLTLSIPAMTRWQQGFFYLWNSIWWDPVTVGALAGVIVWTIRNPARREPALLAGLGLYLLYIVRIGGDFMSGRMLTPCFALAAGMLANADLSGRRVRARAALLGVTALAAALLPYHPLRTRVGYDEAETGRMGPHWIADERTWYYPFTALLLRPRDSPWPMHGSVLEGMHDRTVQPSPYVIVKKNIGFYGYFAGPNAHVVDLNALSDPLLARMPVDDMDDPFFRPGHMARGAPMGYLESLQSGKNLIKSPEVRRYYEVLTLITHGPIWNWERYKAIVRMNLGGL